MVYNVYDGGTEEEKPKNGCFVTKTAGILIFVVVVLILIGAVLMAYYIPQSSCDDGETEDGVPMPDATVTEEPSIEFDGLLPDTLVPYHYRVKLKPYLDEELDGEDWKKLDGETSIYISCIKNTNEIKVHHRLMTISTYEVRDEDGNEIAVTSTEIDNMYAWFIMYTSEDLLAGRNYSLHFVYQGTVDQADIRGFYYSSYMENDIETPFVATHFEPTRARDAFPSFDEPHLKATFDTILVHRTAGVSYERIALSNMENIKNVTDGDWNEAHFATSVKMSTYLNCYVIGEFVCKENSNRTRYQFRVWSRPSTINSTQYSLDIGMDTLTYFEHLFGVDYNLAKMDMVALTAFSPGAMENWGLILYRETRMLYPWEDYKTPATKKGVALIVGHEILHQWCGNYVTMIWWDHIWLNEGFASYFQHDSADYVEPQYHFFDQFFLEDETYSAMQVDQDGSSRPMITPVGFYEEIRSLFDRISYEKGAAIIMMMKSFLGEDVMMEGIRNYIKDNLFSNVHTDDLWQALSEVSPYNMKQIMDTWTLQMGYPVVNVNRVDDVVTADQEHFLVAPYDEVEDDEYTNKGYKWYVPLTYTHQGEKEYINPGMVWMNQDSATIEFTNIDEEHWYLVNINHTAYIRVNYDAENWEKLIKQLNESFEVFPIRSRSALISDAFILGEAQQLDNVIAVRLMEYLYKEDQYLPWDTCISGQYYTLYSLWRTTTYGRWEKYLRYLLSPSYDDLGWDFEYTYSEGNEVEYYRQLTTVRAACFYNHVECAGNATSLYHQWMASPDDDNPIEPNMRHSAYCTSIRLGSHEEWQFAFERQKDDEDEGGRLRSAMACSRDPWVLVGYMETSLDENSGLSPLTTIGYVRDNSGLGFNLAWDFTLDNFNDLHALYETSAYGLVFSFAVKMNTQEDLDSLMSFGSTHYDMPGEAAVGFYEAIKMVKNNINWTDRNAEDIENFLFEVTSRIP
ncbi:aminopeptidase N-like [Saccoglossus kowalevskii]